ncbi:MAG: hypothetical protein KDD70_04440 [Bdellovibrionales bacterium]|nr:hypothetical protein [Bdellovibrionales bacterium]
MNLQNYRGLSPHHRAIVAIAVLLDGHEASLYLGSDSLNGAKLSEVAKEFAEIAPEMRNALAGQCLRSALEEILERASADFPPNPFKDEER